MSSPQFTVTLDGSGKMSKDIFSKMASDRPQQSLSVQERLGSKNGGRVKRGRQDTGDISASDERRHSTGSVVRKRARLDGGDLRHRLSGPPPIPSRTTDLRQRLTSQDSGTFLRPGPTKSATVVRPSFSARQVKTAAEPKVTPVRNAVYSAPQRTVSKTGGVDLRNRLNAVTPLPTAIASSVPSSAPRKLATGPAQSTVTDVRSKPAAAARPVALNRAQPSAPAQSQARPVGVPRAQLAEPAQSQARPVTVPKAQPKLRSEVVLPGAATSVPRLASVVKRANVEPVVAAPVVQVQPAVPAVAATPKTVRGLLISLGLEKYMDIFVREEVDMTALRHMEESDLKELGIPMGPRKKIVQALR